MKKLITIMLLLALPICACGLPAIVVTATPGQNMPGVTGTDTSVPTMPGATGTDTSVPTMPGATGTDTPVPGVIANAEMFLHVATADNTTENFTYIDNPLTNNNPNALVFVTQNWNPGGIGDTYNNASIGVWYDGSVQKWSIFNQNMSAMPVNASFNVWVPAIGPNVFVHTAVADNIVSHYTIIDNPLTNGDPNLMLHVTQNWNPGGLGGTYNDNVIGVWYVDTVQKWAIFNQMGQPMPENAAFNVLIPTAEVTAFWQVAREINTISNHTWIDYPSTNDNPNALVQVTANWNPGGGEGTYDPASFGVWYDSSVQKWSIFNQDMSDMPIPAAFNVIIANP